MKASLALLMSSALVMALGCSGGSSSGSGGSPGTGGSAGGAKGSGGAAGAGLAGHEGAGGTAGQAGAPGGAGGHAGASASGGAGGHAGAGASGGAGGQAGVSASGGAGGHAGTNGGGGGAGGGVPCGKNVCTGNEYCCSETCGLCAPIGSLCVAIACTDAGVTFDAGACLATPSQNSLCTDTTKPNYYRCILSSLGAPCVQVMAGDVTNTFCCP